MTQFLLVRSKAKPDISDLTAEPVTEDDFLRPIAGRVLGSAQQVWVVRPAAGEMDDVVNASLLAMDDGAAYSETSIAKLFEAVAVACDGLACFWSSFPDDLPVADSLAHLHKMIEAQLSGAGTAGELYCQWDLESTR